MQWAISGDSPAVIQSRISWYIREHMRGRRAQVARATGMSPTTLDRYCDFHAERSVGEAGSAKLTGLWSILKAMGCSPAKVIFAAELARSPEEMEILVRCPLAFQLPQSRSEPDLLDLPLRISRAA